LLDGVALGVASSGTALLSYNNTTKRLGVSADGAAAAELLIAGQSGSGALLTNLDAANIATGTLVIARGGTNSSTALNSNRIMVSAAGAVVEAAALANGQILIGSTGAAPVAAALTAGTNVTVTNGAGSIMVEAVYRAFIPFGNIVAVAGAGTLTLLGAGATTVAFSIPRAGTITGASIRVNVIDAARAYNLEVLLNGASVATVALPVSALGAFSTALSVAVAAGDQIGARLVRTSGAGGSTFVGEAALVEIRF